MKSCGMSLIVVSVLFLALTVPGHAQNNQQKFQLPNDAFDELINEANKNIQEELALPNTSSPWIERLRAHALMIALASQHRMAHKPGARQQLATMRDAAVEIGRAIDLDGRRNDLDSVRKQAALLNDYPKIKVDPKAIREIIRLKGIFDQEDIDFHFAKKRQSVGIDRELFAITRLKKPLAAEQITSKYEMLGYKIALLAEMLRDFDDHIPIQKVNERKEWVSHATDVQYTGWALAEASRDKNAANLKNAAVRLHDTCNKCHDKFRNW